VNYLIRKFICFGLTNILFKMTPFKHISMYICMIKHVFKNVCEIYSIFTEVLVDLYFDIIMTLPCIIHDVCFFLKKYNIVLVCK